MKWFHFRRPWCLIFHRTQSPLSTTISTTVSLEFYSSISRPKPRELGVGCMYILDLTKANFQTLMIMKWFHFSWPWCLIFHRTQFPSSTTISTTKAPDFCFISIDKPKPKCHKYWKDRINEKTQEFLLESTCLHIAGWDQKSKPRFYFTYFTPPADRGSLSHKTSLASRVSQEANKLRKRSSTVCIKWKGRRREGGVGR